MIGTPDIMEIRVWTGFPIPRKVEPAQPTGEPDVAEIRQRDSGYPIPLPAEGPQWDIGDPYYPHWTPNSLKPGMVFITAANFGQHGGEVNYANDSTPGDPLIAGSTEEATAKVRTLRWNPDYLPGFDPRIAQWNNLPGGSYYRGHLPSVKGNANFDGSVAKQNVQHPMEFTAPGVASLVQAGLYGN